MIFVLRSDTMECEDAETLPSILFAYTLDGKGGAVALDTAPIEKGQLPENNYWIHLFLDDPHTRPWLEQHSGLDEHIIDALLQQETRPRVSETERGALVIFRGVNLNEGEEPEDMVSIRLHANHERIISVRKRRLRAVHDLREALEHGAGPNTTGEFVAMLSDYLCNRMDPIITQLNEEMDTVEEDVIDKPDIDIRETIASVRKQAIVFHRYLAPQRDTLARLRLSNQNWLYDNDKKLLLESYDRMSRHVEDLNALRERAQIVHDELGFVLSNRLNRNMFLLSIVSAIFLPLTFLTGLLGINVGGIPGANDQDAFWVIVGILATCGLIQLIILKRMKWF